MIDLDSSVGASCVNFRRASFFCKNPKCRKNRFPIFPGYGQIGGKKQISNISRIGLNQKIASNISRILENVADLNFQYFQAGNN